jgi:hypothetical protein
MAWSLALAREVVGTAADDADALSSARSTA